MGGAIIKKPAQDNVIVFVLSLLSVLIFNSQYFVFLESFPWCVPTLWQILLLVEINTNNELIFGCITFNCKCQLLLQFLRLKFYE